MEYNLKLITTIIEGKNPYDLYIDKSNIITETNKYLIESIVNWNYIQIQLIKDIINTDEINIWGHGFDTESSNWSNLSDQQKQIMLMQFLNKSGTLKELREYINSTNKVTRIDTNEYDAKEITAEFKPHSQEFIDQFRESEIYKDMIDICMNNLMSTSLVA
jgi:hypothetical protein